MTYFILQTLFWLLVAFVIGLILGRWIKRLLCKQGESTGSKYTVEEDAVSDTSYTSTADKLAFRNTDDVVPSTGSGGKSDASISAGTAALGAAAIGGSAAAASLASRAFSGDDEVVVDKDTSIDIAAVDSENIEQDISLEAVDTTIPPAVDQVEIDTMDVSVDSRVSNRVDSVDSVVDGAVDSVSMDEPLAIDSEIDSLVNTTGDIDLPDAESLAIDPEKSSDSVDSDVIKTEKDTADFLWEDDDLSPSVEGDSESTDDVDSHLSTGTAAIGVAGVGLVTKALSDTDTDLNTDIDTDSLELVPEDDLAEGIADSAATGTVVGEPDDVNADSLIELDDDLSYPADTESELVVESDETSADNRVKSADDVESIDTESLEVTDSVVEEVADIEMRKAGQAEVESAWEDDDLSDSEELGAASEVNESSDVNTGDVAELEDDTDSHLSAGAAALGVAGAGLAAKALSGTDSDIDTGSAATEAVVDELGDASVDSLIELDDDLSDPADTDVELIVESDEISVDNLVKSADDVESIDTESLEVTDSAEAVVEVDADSDRRKAGQAEVESAWEDDDLSDSEELGAASEVNESSDVNTDDVAELANDSDSNLSAGTAALGVAGAGLVAKALSDTDSDSIENELSEGDLLTHSVDATESVDEGIEDDSGDESNADAAIVTETGEQEENTDNDLLSKGIAAVGAAGIVAGAAGSDSLSDVKSRTGFNSNLEYGEGASVIAGVDSSNLRIIEGIGSKMEELLHENNVYTWRDLSMKSDADLRGILDKYDDRYKDVLLDGWVEQASLLADGRVDELISLQKTNGFSQLEKWLKRS